MVLGIIAIIIAVFSAGFTGWMALMSFREQKVRLRPHVYIDRIDTSDKNDILEGLTSISNCGLLPATNLTITGKISLSNGVEIPAQAESNVILVPNQVIKNRFAVKNPTRASVLSGELELNVLYRLDYHSDKNEYYYEAVFTCNPINKHWIIKKSKAN
jgi:hypothetical protein